MIFALACCAAASCIQATKSKSADPAILAAGERAYQKCYACHSLEGPDVTTQGPSLRKIVGRRIAAEAEFDYSRAMPAYAAKQQVWTRMTLDAFISNPENQIPGNEMGFVGIGDPSERRALINFLSTK